ncbi:MAG: Energy-coupling factor transporter ATP-binding protein EcfA2 [Bacteroidota bacterium]
MIRLVNLHKRFFAGTDREIHALKGVNLELQKGSFTVLVGSNGSGKSTLLNLIAGSIRADEGKIEIYGTDVTRLTAHQRSPLISRVFQDPLMGTVSELTVLENFRLAALRGKTKGLSIGANREFESIVKEKIREIGLGLENKIHQPMGTLSGGQRQALTLTMSVMDQSSLLLMDEPSSALDPATADTIMRLAQKITNQHQLTTLLVTHNLKDAIQYGTRILLMQSGAIAKDLNEDQKKALQPQELINWF